MSTPRSMRVAGVGRKLDVLGSHVAYLLELLLFGDGARSGGLLAAALPSITPMMSDSFMIRRSSPSILTSVPDHLPNRTRSPALTSSGTQLAALVAGAGADGDRLRPACGFSLAVSGMMMPPLVFVFLDASNDDAVVQRTELHCVSPSGCCCFAPPGQRSASPAGTLPMRVLAGDGGDRQGDFCLQEEARRKLCPDDALCVF